jgi:hypothetical protein
MMTGFDATVPSLCSSDPFGPVLSAGIPPGIIATLFVAGKTWIVDQEADRKDGSAGM